MRDDQRFEIERAFDQIPHIVGSSWAVLWFRINEIKNPSREEYRKKVVEYFETLNPLFNSFQKNGKFHDIVSYIEFRKKQEIEKILNGENKEVEKRYARYVDYG